MGTEFSNEKEYLLIIEHYENGVKDIEWHKTLEDARNSIKEAWMAHDYEIYHVNGVSPVEKREI